MEFERGRYPEAPGVYLMKDSQGHVIYVGKAAVLRERLSQYFGSVDSLKTQMLVGQIASIDFVVTQDEKEALILESNLIKSYQPRYNMMLKDARHYSYLAVTGEPFPRLLVARKNSQGRFRTRAARFYGPFVEGSKREISARYLRKLFKIRICGNPLPKKVCLQYHLGHCDAPCIGNISNEDYRKNVEAMESVLSGHARAQNLMDRLQKRMKTASLGQDYEKAAQLRDQMESLRIFFDRQNQRVERQRGGEEDYLWLVRIGTRLHAHRLHSEHGVILKTEKQVMEIHEQEEPELSFCLQFYAAQPLPGRAYSNLAPEAMARLNAALGTDAFQEATGSKRKVLDIAAQTTEQGEVHEAVRQLKAELGLESMPVVIEAFDISTLFGENSVGSMVRFENGKPDKSNYRRFRIRGVSGQDDFAMMKEVVGRRYKRLRDENHPLPDLVLIDGGAGQLHAAMDALEELELQLPVAGLAKREEEIYLPNRMEPLRLARSNAGLKLLQHCRDEAHRFAVGYHRVRRARAMEK